MILFHCGIFKNLKHFYQGYVQRHMKKEFSVMVSYKRFVQLQKKVNVPMAVFVKMMDLGKCTGISFIGFTPIRACHIKRGTQYKTFRSNAQKGQCSLGWLYGFKLHLIINDKGEIPDFILTTGNVDDRGEPLKGMELHKRICLSNFSLTAFI